MVYALYRSAEHFDFGAMWRHSWLEFEIGTNTIVLDLSKYEFRVLVHPDSITTARVIAENLWGDHTPPAW